MSIKEIDSIPGTIKNKSAREAIREDIQEALGKGIKLFEFEGDYNYKYLAQYAREQSEGIEYRKALEIQTKFKEENLFDDEKNIKGFYCFFRSPSSYRRKWIQITSCKGDTHQRVFCQIGDYKRFVDKVINDCIIELKATRAEHKLVDGEWVWLKRGGNE